MANSILVLHGSPRKNGNSVFWAREAIKSAQRRRARVEQVFLHEMNIAPCKGCDGCRKDIKGHCVIRDDMQAIYEKVITANALLLSSPVYWFTYTAQLKLFFDRLYAVQTGILSALKGKKIGIILAYGDVDPFSSGAANAVRTMQDAFNYTKSEIVGIVCGTGGAAGEGHKNKIAIEQARELGKKLASA
jgi:multimeric flavodoxin WrbA